jgi:NADH:ubiquinone oxidoreductase subunit 3 (subunit A)
MGESKWLLNPPVAFIILLFVAWALAQLLKKISFRPNKKQAAGSQESYACGEDSYDHQVHPDYSSFFPFAFFFTLAHVATLIITTVPEQTMGTLLLSAMYVTGAVFGLFILFRK